MNGVLQGRPLSQFRPGFIYEIDDFVGAQLVELRSAVEVRSTDPVVGTEDMDRLTGGIVIVPPDKADERPERRRRKPRAGN
jgi:hypothetical protein